MSSAWLVSSIFVRNHIVSSEFADLNRALIVLDLRQREIVTFAKLLSENVVKLCNRTAEWIAFRRRRHLPAL